MDRSYSPELIQLYNASNWWNSWVYRKCFGGAYERLLRTLQADGRLPPWLGQCQALDCGIGTGLFSQALIHVAGRGIALYGVDISPEMLKRARERLAYSGVPVRLECRDAGSLPLRDGSIDLVLSAFMLEHADNPTESLREMARVARPGAPLVLVLVPPGAPDYWFRWKYRYRPLQPRDLAQWMAAAGWEHVRKYPLTGIARYFGVAYAGERPCF